MSISDLIFLLYDIVPDWSRFTFTDWFTRTNQAVLRTIGFIQGCTLNKNVYSVTFSCICCINKPKLDARLVLYSLMWVYDQLWTLLILKASQYRIDF